jgi:hypothetical protein
MADEHRVLCGHPRRPAVAPGQLDPEELSVVLADHGLGHLAEAPPVREHLIADTDVSNALHSFARDKLLTR